MGGGGYIEIPMRPCFLLLSLPDGWGLKGTESMHSQKLPNPSSTLKKPQPYTLNLAGEKRSRVQRGYGRPHPRRTLDAGTGAVGFLVGRLVGLAFRV